LVHDWLTGMRGGIGFGDYLPERDALYTASRILEMLSRRKNHFGDIWDDIRKQYGNSVYLREDFRIEHGYSRTKLINNIKYKAENTQFPFKLTEISELDGIKMIMEEGRWLLIRPSGTEPVIRIYAEAEDEGITKELIRKGKELVL
ncbi:hypothetical protein ACFLTD_04020, partial [Elusimicrobiota bacterium]